MVFRPLLLGLALVAAGLCAGAARADGLPVVGIDVGNTGVTTPRVRYVTLPLQGNTLVAQIEREGGSVLQRRALRGRFTIPAVAFDGSADGLSADGHTLVLIRPRIAFPRAETSFAVLAADRLHLRALVTLRGDFSFDALSPDGSFLYLIEYLSPRDPTRYQVRVYDVKAGRLLPEPIVDPQEADEAMRGSPLTRVSSPDGRWEYTLYDGGGKTPFVHALDTVGRTARCIDLDALSLLIGSDMSQLRMRLRDGSIVIDAGGSPLVRIDTRTFAVHEPAPASAVTPVASAEPDRGGWWIPVLTALILVAILALAIFRRRPRLARPWRSRSSTTPSR
jgi:hypothetical protein